MSYREERTRLYGEQERLEKELVEALGKAEIINRQLKSVRVKLTDINNEVLRDFHSQLR